MLNIKCWYGIKIKSRFDCDATEKEIDDLIFNTGSEESVFCYIHPRLIKALIKSRKKMFKNSIFRKIRKNRSVKNRKYWRK